MRSPMESTSLAFSHLLLLVIYIPTDSCGQVMECTPSINVQRNTKYETVVEKPLKITCPVMLCGQTFNFTWCRYDMDSCRPVERKHGITYELEKPKEDGKLGFMFLHFGNVSMDHAGKYRCKMSSFARSYVSHDIIIKVNNQESLENRNENGSCTGMLTGEELSSQGYNWIPYFSIFTIILALVILVMMISFLCKYGCKVLQRSRNKDKLHCQDEATKDKLGMSTANQTAVYTDSCHVHDEWDRRDSSIIYVTLNYQSRQEDSARVSIALEDRTEYATIQVS